MLSNLTNTRFLGGINTYRKILIEIKLNRANNQTFVIRIQLFRPSGDPTKICVDWIRPFYKCLFYPEVLTVFS